MAQISIYIPADLQSRMADHDSINWSSYAREAFERAIREDEHVSQAMPELTKRLRASKQKYDAKQKDTGRAQGIRFATEKADYEDLLILRKFLDSDSADGFARELFSYYGGEDDGNFRDDFAYRLFGDEGTEPSDDFVLAFAEAAVEVLNKAEAEMGDDG